jgi:glycosyltransferase involved in cell wall biosynthesis
LARPIKEALGCPVCCTLQGEDLFLENLSEPYRSTSLGLIRANIESADAFVAVSDYYAGSMADYLGIPPDKMHVVPLGINLQGYGPRRPSPSQPFTVGFFARVAPEKGLHLLCEAYRRLRERGDVVEARLEAAGYLAPEHRDYLKGIERKMKDWGLGEEFHYRGVLDREEKIGFLQGLDVFSVPTTCDEPKGLFLLEAMASGVPVVEPRRGSFPEVIERTQGGILVAPEDPDSLAEGILSLYRDPALRLQLGRQGADGVRRHHSVARMADRALEVYGRLSGTEAPQEADAALVEH